MPSGVDKARKVSRLTGCIVVAGLGVGGGFLDYRLVVAARAYCDAGLEADRGVGVRKSGRVAYHLVSRSGAMGRAGRFVGVALDIAVAVAGPVGLVLYDFAVTGTLAGYPGDSGLCGPDNVPPWWPSWLPS